MTQAADHQVSGQFIMGESMFEWWDTLKDPQATILASVITVFAAVIGVLLGSVFFGNRVKNLDSAIDKAIAASEKLNEVLLEQQAKLEDLSNRQQEVLSVVASVRSTQETFAFNEARGAEENDDTSLRERFIGAWTPISNAIDDAANSKGLPKPIKKKYANLGRYDWRLVVSAMAEDGNLLHPVSTVASEASTLWETWKRRSANVPEQAVAQMEGYRDALINLQNGTMP